LVDHTENRGIPIRTLDVNDPSIKGKKIVLWAVLISNLFVIIMLISFVFIYSNQEPFFQSLYILMILLVMISDFGMFLFFHSFFGRNWQKIVFYENGVEFPLYLWDRIKGRERFLSKDEIASVKASFISGQDGVGINTAELHFRTKVGKTYITGQRIKADIISTSEWLETEWKMKVERVDGFGRPIAGPHKIHVVVEPKIMTCEGCGYTFTNDLGFCPSCGRMVSNEKDPTELFGAKGTSYEPQAPTSPNRDHSNQYEKPLPPNQYYPSDQNRGPEYQFPQTNDPGYGADPYQQPIGPYGKDPRLAMILATVLGLLGIMGIGHIYMRKFAKGIVLFIVGGFFALLSLVSIFLIFQPNEFSLEVKIVTAVILSAPFLILLLWQIFDAPKPIRTKPLENRNRWNKP
jgi:hypothetical protein